jgi:Cof subfamily protein (haloacid dehalogenase superfamily)
MREEIMIKLIAMDMDDTALNNELEISGRTREVIQAAVAKGIHVTFATGRMYCSCRRFALELGLDVPLITYNGALIQRVLSDEILFHQPVPLKEARKIAQWADQNGHHLQLYVDDRVYVRECNDKAVWYGHHAGVEMFAVGPLSEFLSKEPTKMLIMADAEKLQQITRELRELCGDAVSITRSKPTFLEIVHPDVSKGKALAHLADFLGIERQAVMAIGDSYNDLEMIEYAGYGVAMDNAHQSIKERADFVTTSNNDDGVAEAIEKFALHGARE